MPAKGNSLDSWLHYISSVHPREIELGLSRIQAVAQRLGITKPAPLVVTVAGTNGKGSCVACMEAIMQQAGIRTAGYTSPHIHLFNERIRIDGSCVDDQSIIQALKQVDAAREQESLSYFEFATLAALYLFQHSAVDVALLEVGLGGRLDAVNIIDADVTVISSIGIDHTDWLGTDIESIAAEKAGIMRANTALVFGGSEVPQAIVDRAASLNSRLYVQGHEFAYSADPSCSAWYWRGTQASGATVELTGLPLPRLSLENVATAMQALQLLPVVLNPADIHQALSGVQLAGRFECRKDSISGRTVILDVAHNPDAMQLLATNLEQYRLRQPGIQRVIAVVAVMADKDIAGMLTALESCVDICYIAQADQTRAMTASKVTQTIKDMKDRENHSKPMSYRQFDSVELAYKTACAQTGQQDIVLVTGSFFTVAAVHALSEQA